MPSHLFEGALPTEPDVKRLLERYGVPLVGQFFPYREVAEVIKSAEGSVRFRTVTMAWRKLIEREHRLLLRAITGRGFEVADARAKLMESGTKFKGGLRKVKRAAAVSSLIDRAELTSDEARQADFYERTGASLRLLAATEAKKLKLPTPGAINSPKPHA